MFRAEEVEKEAKDFSKLEIHPKHRQMIEQVAQVMEKYIDISHLALMGFAWKSIKDWQIEHKMTALEVSLRSRPERDKATWEMFQICRGYLERILRDPEDKGKLKTAIDEAYQYYLDHLSKP